MGEMMNNLVFVDDIAIPEDTKFLILEDTEIFQRKMQHSIKTLGFINDARIFATVESAQLDLKKESPDFILSDWNLPDGKGIDFLAHIRANSAYDHIPFLMVTTMDSIEDILDAVEKGADDYMVKPWAEKEFAEKISFAYSKRKMGLK